MQRLDPVAEPAEQRGDVLTGGRRPEQVDLERDVVTQLVGEDLERAAAAERCDELLRVVVVADAETVVGGALRCGVQAGGRVGDGGFVEPAVGAHERVDDDLEAEGLGGGEHLLLSGRPA